MQTPPDQPPPAQRRAEGVGKELAQIIAEATRQAGVHRRKAAFWDRTYFVVGLPAAALAGIAGITALASAAGRIVAGVVSLAAALLVAAAAFLDSASRSKTHENLAAGWQILANDAHLHVDLDLVDDSWLEYRAREAIQQLLDDEGRLLQGKLPDDEARTIRAAAAQQRK